MTDLERSEKEEFARNASSLLKEYNDKLYSMRKELEDAKAAVQNLARQADVRPQANFLNDANVAQAKLQSLKNRDYSLLQAFETLARRISQRLEHWLQDEDLGIEVQVRLAEFEGNIFYTRDVVNLI